MNFVKPQLNWFDLFVIGLIAYGVWRGKKRGMSEEILDVFQWLCIVVIGAFAYLSLGSFLASFIRMPPFWSNVLAYTCIAVAIKMLFTLVKRAAGEKLVQSDAFGPFEYYLGMAGGVVRFLCVLIFTLSFLHAKYISDAERLATAKMQADNFGAISFPTIGSLQYSIFYESFAGQFIRKNLRDQLVQPARAGSLGGDTIGRRRERAVDEVLK